MSAVCSPWHMHSRTAVLYLDAVCVRTTAHPLKEKALENKRRRSMTAVAPQSPRAARLPVSPSSLRLCRAACLPRTVQSRTGGESHTHTHNAPPPPSDPNLCRPRA